MYHWCQGNDWQENDLLEAKKPSVHDPGKVTNFFIFSNHKHQQELETPMSKGYLNRKSSFLQAGYITWLLPSHAAT